MVYGAWANNPVPITEEAVLRPDVEFVYARQLGSVEQLADEWRLAVAGSHGHRAATGAWRWPPTSTVGLAAALAAGMGQRFGEDDPPAQFLHLDDLASAVVLAAEQRLDGVYNVAPDGWVAGERVRALAGAVPRLKLPDRVTEVIGNLRWRFQRGPIPPGLRSYTRWPWLVANDRLKAEGWAPTVTNEQAYVEGTEAKWWTMVSPKRRQEIALSGLGAVLVALGRQYLASRAPSATQTGCALKLHRRGCAERDGDVGRRLIGVRDGQRDDVVGRVGGDRRLDLIDAGDCDAVDGCDDVADDDAGRGRGSVVGDLVDHEGTLIVGSDVQAHPRRGLCRLRRRQHCTRRWRR